MFHRTVISVAKVELNNGKNDVDVVQNIEPCVDATNFGNAEVNPKSHDNCNYIDPSKSFLEVLVVGLKPHPNNIDDKPNC